MERKILEEYLLDRYERTVSRSVLYFVHSVNQNRNVIARGLWDRNNRLREAMVDGLLYEGIILVEGDEVIYKFPWLKEELEGLVDVVNGLVDNGNI